MVGLSGPELYHQRTPQIALLPSDYSSLPSSYFKYSVADINVDDDLHSERETGNHLSFIALYFCNRFMNLRDN